MTSKYTDQTRVFKDRFHAGEELAQSLLRFAKGNPIVLSLPRGGVVIGYEVAKILRAPLDVIISRKIGLPSNKEFGIGAVSENNTRVLDEQTTAALHITKDTLDDLIQEERMEIDRQILTYRNGKSLPFFKGKTVIVVDDGLATGVTAKAAILAIRKQQPKKIIFASPVCAYDSSKELESYTRKVICLVTPLKMQAIGNWYRNFAQVTDDEVIKLLKGAKAFSQRIKTHIAM